MRFKQSKPTQFSGKYRQYTKKSLLRAYAEVTGKGTSVRKASVLFGVPYGTHLDRVAGRVQACALKNEGTLFSKEEELGIVEFLETFARLGYGVTSSKMKTMLQATLFPSAKASPQ
ncbi:hypothetical protein DPMN_117296 [Dreissena polymorpha]|uniref:HTH psq-type domain-containing protein n=1 Tax=Dreissena polymorpha TaxID=45954 RepID=A0A9D4QVJ1_DREPO|nr:hypothetical protein DPMN_117296 [Dreissena polymorpha]